MKPSQKGSQALKKKKKDQIYPDYQLQYISKIYIQHQQVQVVKEGKDHTHTHI